MPEQQDQDAVKGCAVVGLILVLVVAWLFGACSGEESSQEEQAATTPEETTAEPTQETTREKTREKTTERAQGDRKSEKSKPPEPRTPEERIRANLKQNYVVGVGDNLKALQLWADPGNGCTRVRVDYRETVPALIEHQMQGVYKAVYGDNELSRQVCDVEVNAYGVLSNDYGQSYEQLFYSTHMEGAQAGRVNWQHPERVNFPKVWTLNYKHPSVEQAEAKQELETAIDCAVDEGLFDNWLCPS